MNSLLLEVTYNCNLRCKHCYNADVLKHETDISLTNVRKIIESHNIQHIHMIGGEPLLYSNLDKLFNLKEDLVFSINTNGILLDEAIDSGLLLNCNIKEIIISVDGFNSESNDSIRGDGVYEIVLKNFKRLIEFKNNFRKDLIISISTVIAPSNIENILLGDFKDYKEADNFLFLTMYNSGNALKKQMLTDEFYYKYAQCIYNILNSKYSKKIILDTTPLIMDFFNIKGNQCSCNKDNNVFYSDNKGKIYTCIPARKNEICDIVDDFCTSCPFYAECKKCERGFYFNRVSYCRGLIQYFYENCNAIKIIDPIYLRKYNNQVYIFNSISKEILNYNLNYFEKNFEIRNEMIFAKKNGNLIKKMQEFTHIRSIREYE